MKSLSELNLIDSFIFSCSTENINDAEFIAKLIIKRTTGHTIDKVVIESEKQLKGLHFENRGIRLDLYVTEKVDGEIARIYDIEPNAYVEKDLPYRSRYYQSIADSKNLGKGKRFVKLPEFISIWILSYDPFGEGRMMYHVRNMVEENPTLCYNDGAARIYLYTGGVLGGSKELKALLDFMQNSNDDNATDEELKKLLGIVNRIKGDEKVGEQYMLFKSDLDYERDAAHAEGYVHGIISAMRRFNASDDQIIAALVEECSLTEDEAREKLVRSN